MYYVRYYNKNFSCINDQIYATVFFKLILYCYDIKKKLYLSHFLESLERFLESSAHGCRHLGLPQYLKCFRIKDTQLRSLILDTFCFALFSY